MSWLFPSTTSRFYLRTLTLVALILLPAALLYGDVPARLQSATTAGCYCHCHEASARRGCTKMCDGKKRTVQWLATNCMKPRFQPPADKSGTGPRLRHPDHAEHAQLTK
ncbi:MAG: hypothetical protein ABLT11_11585 [Candidatus Acidiferrum sp.]